MSFGKFAEDSLFLSRFDPEHPLSSCSPHSIHMDDWRWPSVEHYYLAMKFADLELRHRICRAESPFRAQSLARRRFWKQRRDWKALRQGVMTRALYVKCLSHDEVRQALLDTGDRQIVETSQYDYFWGCGRDTRGHNIYGKLLMALRERLREQGRRAAPTSAP